MGVAEAARDVLVVVGPRVVHLHDDGSLRGHAEVSDVDLAAAPGTAADVVASLDRAATSAGLVIAGVWPYDVRGAAFLLCPPDLRFVLPIDLLVDADGRGRYGLRTGPLTAAAVPASGGWLVPTPLDRSLYLVAKRLSKGRVADAEAEIGGLADIGQAMARTVELFGGSMRAAVQDALRGRGDPSAARRLRPERWAGELRRGVRRMARPVGAWVHVRGSAPAIPEAARHLVRPTTAARAVLERRRPGAVLTAGPGPQPLADVELRDGASIGDVVAAMASRVPSTLQRHGAAVGLLEEPR